MEQVAGAKKNTKKAEPKKAAPKKAAPKKTKTTGKKKLTGFMKFLSEKRDEIKKMMPTAKVHEVAKKGGEMWRKLTDSEKKKYL